MAPVTAAPSSNVNEVVAGATLQFRSSSRDQQRGRPRRSVRPRVGRPGGRRPAAQHRGRHRSAGRGGVLRHAPGRSPAGRPPAEPHGDERPLDAHPGSARIPRRVRGCSGAPHLPGVHAWSPEVERKEEAARVGRRNARSLRASVQARRGCDCPPPSADPLCVPRDRRGTPGCLVAHDQRTSFASPYPGTPPSAPLRDQAAHLVDDAPRAARTLPRNSSRCG